MATNFLAHEKIWFDKFKYDDAERQFYERMNGPVAGSSRQVGAALGAPGDLVQGLQQAVSKLEARLSALEKSSPTHRAAAPQPQHVSPMRQVEPPAGKAATAAEDDEDDAIDLFGSDDEEDRRQPKKAGRPALVAKSSILLDVKPVSDPAPDMAQLEACVRSIQLDGLTWGGSKLVPVGYGIRKLQIQCVVEDDKGGTDLLEEEITKFEEHVQSVDIAAFNKI
uniref:Elongation factor 1-delta n=1 Tax=Lynx canadensis TaxID=61383 RepID=A0A667ITC1_LYNCA